MNRVFRDGVKVWRLTIAMLAIFSWGCQSDEEQIQGFMKSGDAYRESDQYDEAIIEYKNALQIDPNLATAHEYLAESYLRTDRIREGYWELGETIRLDPKDVDSRISYATLSLAMNQTEGLLEQVETIAELAPENPKGQLLLGQTYASMDRLDEAEVALRRAIELEPDDRSYYAVLSAVYSRKGQLVEAEVVLREGIEQAPDPILWTLLAQLLFDESRYDEAELALQAAVGAAAQAIEDSDEPATADYVGLSNAYKNLAAGYFQRGNETQAVASLKAGIESLPGNNRELVRVLARYLSEEGQPEEAEALLVRAAEVENSDPEPFLLVSNMRGQSGDLVGALEYAERALEVAPNSTQALLRKAELLIDIGTREEDETQLAAGRGIVTAVLEENPSSPEGLFVLSKVQIADGDLDSAIVSIREALAGKPNWSQGHFILGSALLLKGENNRARSELARAVELNAGLLEARRLLIGLHGRLGEHEYAVDNGVIYLAANPDDSMTRVLVAQSLVRLGQVDEAIELVEVIPPDSRSLEAHFALARLQAAKGDLESARENIEAANEILPNDARILEVMLGFDRADGKISHSIKRVNDAIEAKPDDGDLYRLKGVVGLMSGDQFAAESSLKRAIELNPNDLVAYQSLAQLYSATGRAAETIALYESATKSQPNNAAAHHMLGMLYEMTGKRDQARGEYEAAIENNPEAAEAKNNLAYLMAETEGADLDRALTLAQEAKAAMPDSPNAADTLGWVLYKRGVPSAALGYLREAAQVANADDPALDEIQMHLALAYEANDNPKMAIETYQTLLDRSKSRQAAGKGSASAWAEQAQANIGRLQKSG
ncbi:MAG: tetratricopeptide repeat protein [Myxococcota bacterium]|nr:tetratricopeptide repeat protein [Myxococcota bacterium]